VSSRRSNKDPDGFPITFRRDLNFSPSAHHNPASATPSTHHTRSEQLENHLIARSAQYYHQMTSTPTNNQSVIPWGVVDSPNVTIPIVVSDFQTRPHLPMKESLLLNVSKSVDSIPRFPLDLNDDCDNGAVSLQPRLPTLVRKIRPLFSPKLSPKTSPAFRPTDQMNDFPHSWNKRKAVDDIEYCGFSVDDSLPFAPDVNETDRPTQRVLPIRRTALPIM
jgi:hypothetical protein